MAQFTDTRKSLRLSEVEPAKGIQLDVNLLQFMDLMTDKWAVLINAIITQTRKHMQDARITGMFLALVRVTASFTEKVDSSVNCSLMWSCLLFKINNL